MNRHANHVLQRIATVWTNLTVAIRKMSPSADIRPFTPHDIFQVDRNSPDDEVKFNIKPVVLYLPEKVGRRTDLYIVLKGWLSFGDCDMRKGPLYTKSFGTEVGYFRRKREKLEHIYGVHYDLDETRLGHPVFHAQTSSQIELGQMVREYYRLDADPTNLFEPKIRNIRIPTAQMDVFSTIIQICADHLMDSRADPSVLEAFSDIRIGDRFFVGAAHRMAYLNAPPASQCYRSAHWYR